MCASKHNACPQGLWKCLNQPKHHFNNPYCKFILILTKALVLLQNLCEQLSSCIINSRRDAQLKHSVLVRKIWQNIINYPSLDEIAEEKCFCRN